MHLSHHIKIFEKIKTNYPFKFARRLRVRSLFDAAGWTAAKSYLVSDLGLEEEVAEAVGRAEIDMPEVRWEAKMLFVADKCLCLRK